MALSCEARRRSSCTYSMPKVDRTKAGMSSGRGREKMSKPDGEGEELKAGRGACSAGGPALATVPSGRSTTGGGCVIKMASPAASSGPPAPAGTSVQGAARAHKASSSGYRAEVSRLLYRESTASGCIGPSSFTRASTSAAPSRASARALAAEVAPAAVPQNCVLSRGRGGGPRSLSPSTSSSSNKESMPKDRAAPTSPIPPSNSPCSATSEYSSSSSLPDKEGPPS